MKILPHTDASIPVLLTKLKNTVFVTAAMMDSNNDQDGEEKRTARSSCQQSRV